MVNKWVEHVRQFAKDNGLTYGCALSMPDCKASYQSSKTSKVTPRVEPPNPRDKSYSDLLTMVQQAKQMPQKGRILDKILDKSTPKEKAESDSLIVELARKEMERNVEPMEGTVIKRKSRQPLQVPIYFIKTNFKKKTDLNKAVKKAEKESEEAMKYLSSMTDQNRVYYKKLIFGVIADFEEIHRIEDELTEPDMSPSMITSRQARLKDMEQAVIYKLEKLSKQGFVPKFL